MFLKETPCQPDQFECVSGDLCIDSSEECNGVYDCPDHSDEDPSLCHGNIVALITSKTVLRVLSAMYC